MPGTWCFFFFFFFLQILFSRRHYSLRRTGGGGGGDHDGSREGCEVPADIFGSALQVCMCIHLVTGTAVALLNCLCGYKRLFALSLQEIKLGNPGILSVAVSWLSLLNQCSFPVPQKSESVENFSTQCWNKADSLFPSPKLLWKKTKV